jgi:hypothetical protein
MNIAASGDEDIPEDVALTMLGVVRFETPSAVALIKVKQAKTPNAPPSSK